MSERRATIVGGRASVARRRTSIAGARVVAEERVSERRTWGLFPAQSVAIIALRARREWR